MRALLIVCLFGLMFITSCSGNKSLVYNLNGDLLGEIRVQNESTTILDSYGTAQGKVRGESVTDASGTSLGKVIVREGEMSILNEEGIEVGTLQNKTDCYGKGETFLGRVNSETNANAAAGACLILILSKQPK